MNLLYTKGSILSLNLGQGNQNEHYTSLGQNFACFSPILKNTYDSTLNRFQILEIFKFFLKYTKVDGKNSL